MDWQTVDVYQSRAAEWAVRRGPGSLEPCYRFAARVPQGEWRADLGCGPGWHAPALGEPLVALDAARAMLDMVRQRAPGAAALQASLEALPFRRGSLGGAWAAKSYLHVAATDLPLALADLHRALVPRAPIDLLLHTTRRDRDAPDDFPGRAFAEWDPSDLARVVTGAGFEIDTVEDDGGEWVRVAGTRARTLPDFVAPGMRLLLVGLNPSIYAADAGVGFARPGNRFWPVALAAGLVERDRDPWHALRTRHIGMTDLVKRATTSAREVTVAEFRAGAARVEALVQWLQPAAVVFVGLTGYRASLDKRALAGVQPRAFGGVPAYVMPNPSGLNAHANRDDLAAHLRAAARLADGNRAGPEPGAVS